MTENGPELPGRRRSFMSDALLAASGAALALALVAAGWFALGRSNDPASEQLAGSPPAATSVPEPTAPPAVSMPAPEPPPAAAPPPPPTPTPTPSDEAPTIRKPVGPVSDATQDTDPWADVPTFTVNGVTVMDVEQVAFGEPADDLIEGFNTYFTRSAQWADDGTFVWWGASPGRAVVTLTIGASGGLEGFDVHLEELGNQDMGLVFVSDGGRWLMPGPFSWDRRDIGDRFIYIEDDDEGLAVRCSFRNFCFHQHSEAGPDGLPTGFGEIVRFRADSRTATDYRITANLTATNGQPTALFAAPQPGAVAAFEVDLTNGVTAAMLGQEVVDAEGISWVHLTLERDALRRAYWARAQDLAPAPAADAQGPLPRLEPAQGPLAGLGSAALLTVALAIGNNKKYTPENSLRFAWWGAEESGLIGSTEYIFNPEFGISDEDYEALALYLNFDMVGSPNFIYGVYDADESTFAASAPVPPGSAALEDLFEAYYSIEGIPYEDSEFSGRSDYQAFINVGIPSSGLFTGAEGLKTDAQAAIWGGTAGEQYDPCYHLACDTIANPSLQALDVNVDAIAYAIYNLAGTTEAVNGVVGADVKGTTPDEVVFDGPQGTFVSGGGGSDAHGGDAQ